MAKCLECGGKTKPKAKFCSNKCSNAYNGRLRQAAGIFDPKFVKRFWAKVRTQRDGCWLWTGAKGRGGHGHIYTGSEYVTASRISFHYAYGFEPGTRFVLHRCTTNSCVRPDHLYLGDMADKARDLMSKGLYHVPGPYLGEDNPRAKLTESDVRAIRANYARSAHSATPDTYSSLAEQYGVCSGVIGSVIRRKSWKHVK